MYGFIDYHYIYSQFLRGSMRPLYAGLYPRLLSYAMRVLGTQLSYIAEDCVQDAILNTYLRRDELTDMNKWRGWLLTAIRNNALMVMRKDELSQRYAEHGMLSNDVEEDLLLAIIEQETYSALFAIIDSLPEKYRELFELSFEQGLKNAEVAKLLQVAEITVKKRKAKLIDIIRERLGRDIDENTLMIIAVTGSAFNYMDCF